MDFGIIYQLKTKKYWWLDTILYFVIALFLSTIFCFFIFTIKISFEKEKSKDFDSKLINVGTAQQKDMEKQVIEYQKKIGNFVSILDYHKIPTNVFNMLKESTLTNVWFNNFSINTEASEVLISGETDDIPSLSRQIDVLESKEFVKEVSNLNFNLTETGKISFNFGLLLDPKIFFSFLESPINETPSGDTIQTTNPSSLLFFNFLKNGN
ncbi:hypothetical protein KJ786_01340 [Patescibacteria group bacterium]|nr:hypothetical protein [Patescibacteria group bacterium]